MLFRKLLSRLVAGVHLFHADESGMFQFASGSVFVNPTGGNLATNPTPMKLGTVQDASADFSCTLKELRGQLQFPDDVAPGDKKITWKATLGKVEISLFNQVFFADDYTTSGQINQVDSENHTVPAGGSLPVWAAATPYVLGNVITDGTNGQLCVYAGTSQTPTHPTWNTHLDQFTPDNTVIWQNIGPPGSTVTVTNQATFNEDMGVTYGSGPNVGAPLQRVPSGPATGEYSMTDGVYTFATADATLIVLISYNYTAMTGQMLTVNNQYMGYGPTFELWFYWRYQGQSGLWLTTCRASKLGTPAKRDNYIIVDLEGEAYASPAGKVGAFFQAPA